MANTGGFGAILSIGDGLLAATPTYTTIAQVETFPELEREAVMSETTAHDSPGGYEEFVPSGLKKTSPLKLVLGFDETQATHANASGGIQYEFEQGTAKAYKITFPNTGASTWESDCYVSKFKWTSKKEAHWQAEVELRPTGQPTLTE